MVWQVLYWVLLSIAFLVLLRGLLWDRAGFRGRPVRRCRRCWYDLTGLDGDVTRTPVVCPECGRAHKTKRSMRRTRRSRRWIAAALVLGVMAYGSRVTPEVQRRGWGAAVPRVVLVLSLPFVSEEPGSGMTGGGFMAVTTIKISAFERMVLAEIRGHFGGGLYTPGSDRGFGWFSRRLTFLLARTERTEVITDGTTAKGSAYRQLLGAIIRADGAYGFEEQWTLDQNHIEVEFTRAFGPQEPVRGIVRMRGLSDRVELVMFGDPLTKYNYALRPQIFGFGNGIMATGNTPAETDRMLIDQSTWSQFWAEQERSSYYDPEFFGGYPLGRGQLNGDGTANVRAVFSFARYPRNEQGHLDREAEPVALHQEVLDLQYSIDEDRQIQIDTSREMRSTLESAFVARLMVVYKRSEDRWVPVVELTHNGALAREGQGVIFGGNVEIREVPVNGGDQTNITYMKSHHRTWWRWGPKQPRPPIENSVIEFEGQAVDLNEFLDRPVRYDLHAQADWATRIPGEVHANHHAVGRVLNGATKLVVRIEGRLQLNHLHFGGLWGERVYEGTLEFDLPKWNVREIERYIVSGIAPEHSY